MLAQERKKKKTKKIEWKVAKYNNKKKTPSDNNKTLCFFAYLNSFILCFYFFSLLCRFGNFLYAFNDDGKSVCGEGGIAEGYWIMISIRNIKKMFSSKVVLNITKHTSWYEDKDDGKMALGQDDFLILFFIHFLVFLLLIEI